MGIDLGFQWKQALVLAGFMACQVAPEQVQGPALLEAPTQLEVDVSAYVGTCLSGPRPGGGVGDVEVDPFKALPLTVELWMTSAAPAVWGAGLQPLSDVTRLVLVEGQRTPLNSTSSLFNGARVGMGLIADELHAELQQADQSEALLLFQSTESIPSGITFKLSVRRDELVNDPGNFLGEFATRPPVEKAIELLLERSGEDFNWLVGLASARTFGSDRMIGTPTQARFRPGSAQPLHEQLAPKLELGPGSAVLVFLPSVFQLPVGRGFGLYFRIGESFGRDADRERQAAVESGLLTTLERVQSSSERLESGLTLASPGDFVVDTARESLAQLDGLVVAGVNPRPTLVFLSGVLDAPMARDLVLVLDRAPLDELARGLVEASKADPSSLRWSLESLAWMELVRILRARDENALELRAVLRSMALSGAGQLGAFPSLIEDAVHFSSDLASFDQRLIDENWIFLEDSNPAARSRAFAWLKRRGLAPSGFDPLGPHANRRAVLEGTVE